MKSFILFSIIFLIHGGGTDSRGGHNDRINGGYHFHHGNPAHSHFDGGCPYLDDDDSFFSALLFDIGIIFFGVILYWVWTNLYDYYLNRKIEKKSILERITFVKSQDSKLLFIGLAFISIILLIHLIYDIVFLDFSFGKEAILAIIFLPIMCYFFPKWLDK